MEQILEDPRQNLDAHLKKSSSLYGPSDTEKVLPIQEIGGEPVQGAPRDIHPLPKPIRQDATVSKAELVTTAVTQAKKDSHNSETTGS